MSRSDPNVPYAAARAHDRGRLEAIASLVPRGSRVADVGAGHLVLSRLLLESGRARHCIATERTAARLARLGGLPTDGPLATRLELRAGDGLAPLRLSDGVEVVIVAGVGGRTVVRILGARSEREALGAGRLVIQAQSEVARVRGWLVGSGLTIVAERLVRDRGRFYEVLAAEPHEPFRTPEHPLLALDDLLAVGPCLVRSRNPAVGRLWEARLEWHERILARCPRSDRRERILRGRDQARRVLAALG